MLKALQKHLRRPDLFGGDCVCLTQRSQTYGHTKYRFQLLLKIIGGTLPQLGGTYFNVVNEINKIVVQDDNTLNSLFTRFAILQENLAVTKIHAPLNALLSKYFELLQSFSHLQPYFMTLYQDFT